MAKKNIPFLALGIVFLAVAIVFYDETSISLGKFILFFMSGFASGILFIRGIKK